MCHRAPMTPCVKPWRVLVTDFAVDPGRVGPLHRRATKHLVNSFESGSQAAESAQKLMAAVPKHPLRPLRGHGAQQSAVGRAVRHGYVFAPAVRAADPAMLAGLGIVVRLQEQSGSGCRVGPAVEFSDIGLGERVRGLSLTEGNHNSSHGPGTGLLTKRRITGVLTLAVIGIIRNEDTI